MSKFCNKIITIPQFESTCWFNAILMAILYSQNSRKLLLNDELFFKQKTKITKIISHILTNQYISNKYVEQYFKIMAPEKILKYLNILDDFRISITKNGWFSNFFLPIFIERACIKSCLCLDLYKKNIYVEFIKKIRFVHTLNNGVAEGIDFYDDKISDIDLAFHIKEKLQQPNPDYIFLNIGHETSSDIYTEYLISNINRNNNFLNLNYYPEIKTSGFQETKDEIIYNNDTYILDSCIIGNYNINQINLGHAIVGITCKNEKYVYNGWVRITNDPAMVFNKKTNDKLLPCELMKFDWRVNNKDSNFCINEKMCKLDIIQSNNDRIEKQNLCFSFGNGIRTLIYVKKLKKDIKSIDDNILHTNPTTITLPTRTPKPEDIFVDIKRDDGNKKLQAKIKNIKQKEGLVLKLKELKKREKQLQIEIEELQLKIKK